MNISSGARLAGPGTNPLTTERKLPIHYFWNAGHCVRGMQPPIWRGRAPHLEWSGPFDACQQRCQDRKCADLNDLIHCLNISEGRMSKILTVVTVAGLLAFAPGGTANAQFKGSPSGQAATAGKCPDNTCAKDGSGFAKNIKNCAAANCKK
jgi:hypothetical protein